MLTATGEQRPSTADAPSPGVQSDTLTLHLFSAYCPASISDYGFQVSGHRRRNRRAGNQTDALNLATL
jgi:hypothetical protein